MAGVIENYSKSEVRAVVRLLQAGVSQSDIHHSVVSVHGSNIFNRKEESM
jgi:hypothetical protein